MSILRKGHVTLSNLSVKGPTLGFTTCSLDLLLELEPFNYGSVGLQHYRNYFQHISAFKSFVRLGDPSVFMWQSFSAIYKKRGVFTRHRPVTLCLRNHLDKRVFTVY